jgi:hypothetical protein
LGRRSGKTESILEAKGSTDPAIYLYLDPPFSYLSLSLSLLSPQRSSTVLAADRRAAFGTFGQIAVGAAVFAGLPQVASADGAVSAGTITKAKAVYGARIYALKKAVDAGDFEAIAADKAAFVLFNSGAYPNVKTKPMKAEAIKGTNAIFAAMKAGDKAACKTAYTKYVADNGIKPFPVVDVATGQGYSGDFDYRVRTSAAAIYQR